MTDRTLRPIDNYDPAWSRYWTEHPRAARSVGAAAADAGAAAGAGSGDGAGAGGAAAAAAAAAGAAGAGGEGAGAAAGAAAGDMGAGKVTPTWRDAIKDPDLKKHAERFDTPESAIKANLEARQLLSRAIVPPGKDAKPEEVAAYRKSLGVPEKPEDYKFATPAGREATEADKAFQGTMAKLFHGANIGADQAKALNEGWNQYVEQAVAAEAAADKQFAEQSVAALKQKWGPDYDKNLAIANRAAARIYGDKLADVRSIQTKDGRFVLDHPAFVEAFAQIGREMGEGNLGPALSEGERQTVQQKIDDLQKQKMAAMDRSDSLAAARLEKEQAALYARLSGNAPVVGSQGRVA